MNSIGWFRRSKAAVFSPVVENAPTVTDASRALGVNRKYSYVVLTKISMFDVPEEDQEKERAARQTPVRMLFSGTA